MLLKKMNRNLTYLIPYVERHWNMTNTLQVIKINLHFKCTCGTPCAYQDFLHFLFFNLTTNMTCICFNKHILTTIEPWTTIGLSNPALHFLFFNLMEYCLSNGRVGWFWDSNRTKPKLSVFLVSIKIKLLCLKFKPNQSIRFGLNHFYMWKKC